MRTSWPLASPGARRLAAALAVALLGATRAMAQGWSGYGGDPEHSAVAAVAAQVPQVVRWSTPVDLQPQYNDGELLIHYGTPLITRLNTVLVTVKTGQFDGFRVDALRGRDGALLWSLPTDYSVPNHGWVPSCGGALTPGDARLIIPAAGGTVLARSSPDHAAAATTRLAFYGLAHYNANPVAFNNTVKISTPITADRDGNLYFGFVAGGAPLPNLQSGLARISSTGVGSWVNVSSLFPDGSMQKVAYNCAPALSGDGRTVYVAVNSNAASGFGSGYLVALNSATLAPKAKVFLRDVLNPRNPATIADDGTASPTVGPDGDVYYGVLENPVYPSPANHARGWLLHFNADLSRTKTPGAFGWDDTASVVDASLVPSYHGSSPYLLLTKYNNYVEGGGDGVNKLAIVDPNASRVDPISGATVMREALTIAGATPDAEFLNTHPRAVREWCVNTAAVDPVRKCALVNSEDGHLYRWDFKTNTLASSLLLNGSVGEAYTPTIIGPDGAVYAINNARLYSCVATPTVASPSPAPVGTPTTTPFIPNPPRRLRRPPPPGMNPPNRGH
jgi:hypothetical protein